MRVYTNTGRDGPQQVAVAGPLPQEAGQPKLEAPPQRRIGEGGSHPAPPPNYAEFLFV